jgi:mevalonate kinase
LTGSVLCGTMREIEMSTKPRSNTLTTSNLTVKSFVVDVAERAVSAFLATAAALYGPVVFAVSTGTNFHVLTDLSLVQKAALAGSAAALVVVKGAVSTFVGDSTSPAFLPTWLTKLLGIQTIPGKVAVAPPDAVEK